MPAQKEVIHLTFGTLAHHLTTHFFNQQSSHFQYSTNEQSLARGEEEEQENDYGHANASQLVLDPNVDFQEGIGKLSSEPTFFPRQVVIDFRDAIGARWDAYDVVFADQEQGEHAAASDDYAGTLWSSRAAEEGLKAWNSLAEVQRTHAQSGVQQRQVWSDEEDDDDMEESDGEDTFDRKEGESKVDTHTLQSSRRYRGFTSKRKTPASYAHNPSHPRSLRTLPNLFGAGGLVPMGDATHIDGKTPFSTFEMGMGLSRQMDRDESLFDEHIRWFAEDSDQMQSFSLYTSTFDAFSGMAHETMQSLADNYPKTSVLAWGADMDGQHEGLDDASSERLARLRTTNNALSLWSLSSASMYTPMSVPASLMNRKKHTGKAEEFYSSRVNWSSMSNVGALFAAHIDTATLTCRLHDQSRRTTAFALASGLNWRLNTPVAMLTGCMPMPLLAPVEPEKSHAIDPIEALLAAKGYGARKSSEKQRRIDSPQERAQRAATAIDERFVRLTSRPFSLSTQGREISPFAQASVARDEDDLSLKPTQEALEAWSSLDEPSGRVDVVPLSFNVRAASFPQLFRRLTSNGRPLPPDGVQRTQGRHARVNAMPMMASLSTTPESTTMLADARRWIDQTMIKGHAPLSMFGIGGSRGRSGAGQAANDETEGFLGGREGLFEVRERLEELLGAYEEGLPAGCGAYDGDERNDKIGTDEEFGDDGDGADDDLDWD